MSDRHTPFDRASLEPMNITLRQAAAADHPFVQEVYFETQREVIEQIFGLHGDAHENEWFDGFYREASTQIILVDGHEAGFMTLLRHAGTTTIQCLFLRSEHQGRGIGTNLLQTIIAESTSDGRRLTIGTERGNPAKRLYERLGFAVIRETKYRLEFLWAAGTPTTCDEVIKMPGERRGAIEDE